MCKDWRSLRECICSGACLMATRVSAGCFTWVTEVCTTELMRGERDATPNPLEVEDWLCCGCASVLAARWLKLKGVTG
jgi:hypothetical protein